MRLIRPRPVRPVVNGTPWMLLRDMTDHEEPLARARTAAQAKHAAQREYPNGAIAEPELTADRTEWIVRVTLPHPH